MSEVVVTMLSARLVLLRLRNYLFSGEKMTEHEQTISIHLRGGQRNVELLRTEGSLTVKLGMATSQEDIRLALQASVTHSELQQILRIWADDNAQRLFEVVGDIAIISEVAQPQ
jgi:hypothetical protein